MSMKPGTTDFAGAVEDVPRLDVPEITDRGDELARHRNVGPNRGGTGSVDDLTANQLQIALRHRVPFRNRPVQGCTVVSSQGEHQGLSVVRIACS